MENIVSINESAIIKVKEMIQSACENNLDLLELDGLHLTTADLNELIFDIKRVPTITKLVIFNDPLFPHFPESIGELGKLLSYIFIIVRNLPIFQSL